MPTYKKSTEGVAALMRRYETAKQHRSSWESHWKECYEYALPQREVFSDHSEGAKKNTKIYDSTALIGTQRYTYSPLAVPMNYRITQEICTHHRCL
jgi:hypothetical protein